MNWVKNGDNYECCILHTKNYDVWLQDTGNYILLNVKTDKEEYTINSFFRYVHKYFIFVCVETELKAKENKLKNDKTTEEYLNYLYSWGWSNFFFVDDVAKKAFYSFASNYDKEKEYKLLWSIIVEETAKQMKERALVFLERAVINSIHDIRNHTKDEV